MNKAGENRCYNERTWIAHDGLSLFARDYPGIDGRACLPVICLHGLTRNSRDFEDVAPLIAGSGRRVIVPDVRGRGRSAYDPDPANYNPRVYARDIAGLLDHLGIRRAVFVGTSMGGLITMALALKHRRAIAAIVLNDVGPEVAAEGIARISGYAGKPVHIENWDDARAYARRTAGPAYPEFQAADWDRFVSRTFSMAVNGKPALDYDPGISKPIAKGQANMSSWLAWLLFRRATAGRPSLLIRGSMSDIVTGDIALRMNRANARLKIVEVPGVGHAPTLDEPVARQALMDFIASVP